MPMAHHKYDSAEQKACNDFRELMAAYCSACLGSLQLIPWRPKRGPAPKLQQQLEQLSQLPKAKQRLVCEVLDSLLAANRNNEQASVNKKARAIRGLLLSRRRATGPPYDHA